MKILIITPFYYIEGRPDLFHDTNCVHYFAKYWAADHDVRVFNVYPHSYKAISRYKSAEARGYYTRGYEFEKDNVKVHLGEVQKFPGQKGNYFPLQVSQIMKQFKLMMSNHEFIPDIIIAHVPTYTIGFIEKIKSYFRKKIPVIGVLHNTDIEELRVRKNLSTQLCNCYDAIYARSHGIYQKAKKYPIVCLKKDIIQSGIPLQMSEGLRAPTSVETGLKLIYVGKLIHRKHADVVIQALAHFSDVDITLDIIGSGPEKNKLKKLVNDLNISDKVHFYENISREKVIQQMAKAHIFCMPSVKETLGLTYLEAMSVGCVPIGTKGEGIDGVIVHGENGFLIDPTQMQQEVEKIIDIYIGMSQQQRQLISDHAYDTATTLSEESCAERYLQLIKRSIG